jgi:hypothetical protein
MREQILERGNWRVPDAAFAESIGLKRDSSRPPNVGAKLNLDGAVLAIWDTNMSHIASGYPGLACYPAPQAV